MKKIKLLYDVAKTMKNMAKMDGVITVEVQKDRQTVFLLENNFERDKAGKVKGDSRTYSKKFAKKLNPIRPILPISKPSGGPATGSIHDMYRLQDADEG